MVKLGACRKAGLAVAVLFAVCIGSASAAPVTLWYSGGSDGVNGLVSEGNPSSAFQTMIYDDFTVPVGGWTVQEVWANQAVLFGDENPPADVYWEIRSGMTDGSGGTLYASGTDAGVFTATGGYNFGNLEYKVDVSGLNVALVPGTYWLGVAPVDDGSGVYWAETTSGRAQSARRTMETRSSTAIILATYL